MKMLYDEGFPVPKPIDQNRHALLMELVPGTLLNNITELGDASKVYRRALELMVKLGEAGLIHGDFNEFNLMVTNDQRVVMIDFPQMVSINHPNAAELFDRDVHNLANFFQRRFKVDTTWYPTLENDVVRKGELDKQVYASGHFTRQHQEDLERLMEEGFQREKDAADGDGENDEEEEEDSNSDDDVDEADIDDSKKEKLTNVPRRTGDSGDDDDDGGDSSSHASSLDEAMADARELRQGEFYARNSHRNPNFLPDGGINEDHVKHQIRKSIRRKDNNDFNRHLHRNVQKGRQKQKIQNQLKNTKDGGFFD